MGLKKSKQVKGIDADYWRIHRNDQNAAEDKTCVRLALYLSQEARDFDVRNFLELEAFTFDGVDYTRDELYAKIKESKMGTRVLVEGVEAVEGQSERTETYTDEEGQEQITIIPAVEAVEGVEEVIEEYETNWFFDAEDV